MTRFLSFGLRPSLAWVDIVSAAVFTKPLCVSSVLGVAISSSAFRGTGSSGRSSTTVADKSEDGAAGAGSKSEDTATRAGDRAEGTSRGAPDDTEKIAASWDIAGVPGSKEHSIGLSTGNVWSAGAGGTMDVIGRRGSCEHEECSGAEALGAAEDGESVLSPDIIAELLARERISLSPAVSGRSEQVLTGSPGDIDERAPQSLAIACSAASGGLAKGAGAVMTERSGDGRYACADCARSLKYCRPACARLIDENRSPKEGRAAAGSLEVVGRVGCSFDGVQTRPSLCTRSWVKLVVCSVLVA